MYYSKRQKKKTPRIPVHGCTTNIKQLVLSTADESLRCNWTVSNSIVYMCTNVLSTTSTVETFHYKTEYNIKEYLHRKIQFQSLHNSLLCR